MTAPLFADTNLLCLLADARDAAKQERAAKLAGLPVGHAARPPQPAGPSGVLRDGDAQAPARSNRRGSEGRRASPVPLALPDRARRAGGGGLGAPGPMLALLLRCVIVGAAQTMGCGFVLSEDLPSGQDLGGVRVVNPFETRPDDLQDEAPAGCRPSAPRGPATLQPEGDPCSSPLP